jgi:hypothetical protein
MTDEEYAGINACASLRQIDPITLRSQVFLHLPRPNSDFQEELNAAADLIEGTQRPYAQWLEPPIHPVTLNDLELITLDPEIAKIYHERFHYVGSYRPGWHFALKIKGSDKIACIGSVATCDLNHVLEKIAPHPALTYSRFFAFRWAPKYIFSHFWGKLRQIMIKEYGAELMFTFINPNIGFDGCSHKAAQFTEFGYEEGARNMYLNGRYRTMRYFVDNYGTSNEDILGEIPGFQISAVLQPLMILANPLKRGAEKVIPATPYRFQRPKLGLAKSKIEP